MLDAPKAAEWKATRPTTDEAGTMLASGVGFASPRIWNRRSEPVESMAAMRWVYTTPLALWMVMTSPTARTSVFGWSMATSEPMRVPCR